jgi:phosphatidylinositol 3-kinase
MCVVSDPEADVENPCDAKYQWLARGLLRHAANPDLKPNVVESADIQAAVLAPILTLRASRDLPKSLLWKFRYSLINNKKALVKFVMSVLWESEDDAREAAE